MEPTGATPGPHGSQRLVLAPWGRRYLKAVEEWQIGMRATEPLVEEFRLRVMVGQRTTLPGDSTGPAAPALTARVVSSAS